MKKKKASMTDFSFATKEKGGLDAWECAKVYVLLAQVAVTTINRMGQAVTTINRMGQAVATIEEKGSMFLGGAD